MQRKKGSFAHLVAEQHDDHILLGILVYFSQPSLWKYKRQTDREDEEKERLVYKQNKYHLLKSVFSLSSWAMYYYHPPINHGETESLLSLNTFIAFHYWNWELCSDANDNIMSFPKRGLWENVGGLRSTLHVKRQSGAFSLRGFSKWKWKEKKEREREEEGGKSNLIQPYPDIVKRQLAGDIIKQK